MSDLQLQNRRLSEENGKLREQLESNEEMSSNVVRELEDLRDAVKRCEHNCIGFKMSY